jgi:hypothetical protein
MAAPQQVRRQFLRELPRADISQVLGIAAREAGTPYALWRDDPCGFVEDVLNESLWSKPREILTALPAERRVAVPSCFGSSKTWSGARAVLHFAYTHPVGTAKVVTIAPFWRQVVRQLWPEIRSAHSRAGLPGAVDAAQLKLTDAAGMETVVAYGISAPPWNEAAVQGIHAPQLLLVVDEAGGIGHVIGRNLRALMVGDGTQMLAIGNPPTDEEGSWFEGLCALDNVHTIPIDAAETPNLSREQAPACKSCPPEVQAHSLASHLVDIDWVKDTIAEHGEDSNYVQAKVHARFPSGGPRRIIPAGWVDAAHLSEEPEGGQFVRLADLEIPDESTTWKVERGAWVRLGVDVAADGGDELVIARCVGDLVTIEHRSSGAENSNSVDVAGVVLAEIRRAERLRWALKSKAPVRVKIDGIGVGWGVAGTLTSWAREGVHSAEIETVVVSEKTNREPDSATLRPYRKRDELWLAGRSLLQPSPQAPAGRLRLRVDGRTLAQLRSPTMTTSSTGHTTVEPKKSLRARGLPSPDRAEALLLSIYEPGPEPRKRPKAKLIA